MTTLSTFPAFSHPIAVPLDHGPTLTWSQMLAIEPRLSELARQARRVSTDDFRSYMALKRRLQLLCGWHAEKPRLRSSEAFEEAHRIIFARFRGGR